MTKQLFFHDFETNKKISQVLVYALWLKESSVFLPPCDLLGKQGCHSFALMYVLIIITTLRAVWGIFVEIFNF